MAQREFSRKPSRSSAPQEMFAGMARAELFLSIVHWFACRLRRRSPPQRRARQQHYTASGFSPALPLAIQAEALYYGAVPVGDGFASARSFRNGRADSPARGKRQPRSSGALRAVEGGIEDGQLLLAHARSLYEDIGNEQGLLMTWSPLCVEVEALAGNRDVAKAHFRASIDRLRSTTHSVAHASTQAALLADLLLDGGETDEADMYARLAETRRCRPTCSCSSSGAAHVPASSAGPARRPRQRRLRATR